MQKYSVSSFRSLLILSALCLVSCAHRAAISWNNSKIDKRPAIILISGYYGSVLREIDSHQARFISAGQVFFSSKSLSLYNAELETPAAYQVEPEGILGAVTIFPLLFSADVYGGFYKDLQEMSGDKAQVIPFVYDWRQDLPQAAAKLSDLVDQLLGAGVSQVDIVAHSMGGMVASYYLAYGNQEPKEAKLTWQGAQKIRKFLVMGTPFQGVFSVFRNMQKGAPLGGNRTLLPPEAVASFPASYQLMPLQNPHVLNLENQIQKLPLAEIETWQDRKLGLLRRQDLGEEVHGRRENFLRSQLARAQKFSDLLQLKDPSVPKPDHLKVMNVIGEGHLVAETALYDAEQKLFIFDVDDPKSWGFSENNFWSEGDGTVSITSATLPKGLAPGALVFRTRAGHTELWRDPVLQKEIQKFLVLY